MYIVDITLSIDAIDIWIIKIIIKDLIPLLGYKNILSFPSNFEETTIINKLWIVIY